ncbi:MAG TPA: hypothetical protein PKW55_07255 [Spirochaetota bacterium]|nr:hypothetical protein [Spirochaetota bacterium]HOM38622.1 hypothetical protein [Spirochaetota bacterium]HPQ49759.1 hypothetical protein [Spirochaetota bacterium]
MIEIIKDKRTIKFYGDIKVNKIKNVYKTLLDNIEDIKKWDKIKIDIRELESADSSFYQILISLTRSFKDKIRISTVNDDIQKDLSFYRLFIKTSSV